MTLFFYGLRKIVFVSAAMAAIASGLILLALTSDILRRFAGIASARDAFLIGMFQTPFVLGLLMPVILLGAAHVAMLQHIRHHELHVLLTSGFSPLRLLAPSLVFGLIFGILDAGVISEFSLRSLHQAQAYEAKLLGIRHSWLVAPPLWMHQPLPDGYYVLHAARAMDGGRSLSDVEVYRHGSNGDLTAIYIAEEGVRDTNRWILTAGQILQTGSPSQPTEFESKSLPATGLAESPRFGFGMLAPISLHGVVQTLVAGGFQDQLPFLKSWLHRYLARPLLFAGVILAGGAWDMHCGRRVRRFRSVLCLVLLGLMTIAFLKISADLGESGLATPAFAAWFPACFTMLIGVAIVGLRECR